MEDRGAVVFHEVGDVPLRVAKEMAAIGIIPLGKATLGENFTLAGQPFVVTGETTKAEWLTALTSVFGLAVAKEFHDGCPETFRFWKISTD